MNSISGIGAATAIGLIVALLIIRWLWPLGAPAIGLITVICCGLSAKIGSLMTRTGKDKGGK